MANDDPKIAAWREESNRFHKELVKERGGGWQAFWGSQESQRVRYQVFLRHLPLAGASVIDVGCGFGDFYGYLGEQGLAFSRYLGIDLAADMVYEARRRHAGAHFQMMDILTEDPPFAPDVIVASGIAAVGFTGYDEYVLRILRRFHHLARRGFAMNFLSTCTKKPDPRSHYVDPAWLLSLFQKNVDWRCVLVHDYRPNDFTLVHTRT